MCTILANTVITHYFVFVKGVFPIPNENTKKFFRLLDTVFGHKKRNGIKIPFLGKQLMI